MIHRRTHPEFVPGCKPCKWATVSFGTVPGGAKDRRSGISGANRRERELHRYREKRRAGEQPDGTTTEAMEKYEKRVASWERAERKLSDDNPTDTVKRLEKATFNQARRAKAA